MNRITPLLIAASPIIYGIIDVLLDVLKGNSWTISYVILLIRFKHPTVALSVAYSCGLLCRHCFFPVTVPAPPVWLAIAKALIALIPTFYAMAVTLIAGEFQEAHRRALNAGGPMWFAVWVIVSFVAGFAAGFLVQQHVTSDELVGMQLD